MTLAWGLVALCTASIWLMSTDTFSADHTGSLLDSFLGRIWPDLDLATLNAVHLAIRKAAHFLEYAILALLTCRALWISGEMPRGRLGALAMGLVGFVASVDEIRQSFSLVRTGALADIAIDLGGGLAAVALYLTWRRSRDLPPAATRFEA